MAELGIGSKVYYGGSTEIPNCKSITLPSLEFAQVDTSNLGTSGNVKTYVASPLATPSKMQIEALFTHTVSEALLAIEGVVESWKVVIAGSSGDRDYHFSGFVSKVERKIAGYEELDMLSIEVQMSGPLTVAGT